MCCTYVLYACVQHMYYNCVVLTCMCASVLCHVRSVRAWEDLRKEVVEGMGYGLVALRVKVCSQVSSLLSLNIT